jgi:hypothetical protein
VSIYHRVFTPAAPAPGALPVLVLHGGPGAPQAAPWGSLLAC